MAEINVWFAIPSCRPVAEASPRLDMWRRQGYKIALLRQGEEIPVDLSVPTGEYLGWARSVNILAKKILEMDPTAAFIVTGGDDYCPDMSHDAVEIGKQCTSHFWNNYECTYPPNRPKWGLHDYYSGNTAAIGTFGIMQPTGDRWGDSAASRQVFGEDRGALLDRICGSPWMGRTWCERAYGGNGPLCAEYWHLHADEELHEVATKLGVLWQRSDLIQHHDHPLRKDGASQADWPEFLKPINTPESWNRHQQLFNARKRAGFPGHEPLVPGHEPQVSTVAAVA